MAKFICGDLVPFGSALVRIPGAWVHDDNEATECYQCGLGLRLIDGQDEDGNPTAHYGDPEHITANGQQCCSESCAALYDLDVRAGLDCLARYLERLGSALPTIGVGFSRVNVVSYVRELHKRHDYALGKGHHLSEVIKESVG